MQYQTNDINFIRHQTDFGDNADGLFLRRQQEIPDEFLTACRDDRFASSAPAGEYHCVASIPTVVLEVWKSQGFDYINAPIKDIVRRLRNEGLDDFLTSNKSL